MTRDEQLSVKNFGYEKVIKELELINQNFNGIEQLHDKILELCQENPVLFVTLKDHVNNGFIVGKYHARDPKGVFEIIIFTVLDKSKYTQSVIENIRNGIISGPSVRELYRIIGKNVHKMTHYYSHYTKLHQFNSSNSISNLLYDHPPATWSRTESLLDDLV